MDAISRFRICYVCTGNICRSPMAAVVMRSLVAERGWADAVEISSAGTGGWHVGDRADWRALDVLAEAGYDGSAHRARQFDPAWFGSLDLILALDQGHARELWAMARTPEERAKVRLLLSYLPSDLGSLDVADPYYLGREAFERVLDQVERANRAVLDSVATIIEGGGPHAPGRA